MAAITQGASSAEVRGSPSKAQCLTEENLSPLPVELIQKIFGYLSDQDQARASCVCRDGKKCIAGLPERLLGRVHGKDAWAHLGDVGEEPPLPKRIDQILDEPCPAVLGLERFGETIGETHILVLIPKTLDGDPLTLGRFKTLLDQGKGPKIRVWFPGDNENTSPGSSYWALISKDFIKNSNKQTYTQQKKKITKLGANYRLPKVIEMVYGLYMQKKTHGDNLLYNRSWARCEESYRKRSNNSPMIVRGYDGNVDVSALSTEAGFYSVGVGVSWNFSF